MIAACDVQGFVSSCCQVIAAVGSGEDVGPIDRDRFERWVEEKLVPQLGNYAFGEPRSIVILDNATIHHSDRIVQMIEDKGARILYLPPYSPDLNPIELFFSSYKKALQRLGSQYRWGTCHSLAIESVSPADARNSFFHCGIAVHHEDEDEKKTLIYLLVIFSYSTYI
jgi:hypothetical protein